MSNDFHFTSVAVDFLACKCRNFNVSVMCQIFKKVTVACPITPSTPLYMYMYQNRAGEAKSMLLFYFIGTLPGDYRGSALATAQEFPVLNLPGG